VGTLIRYDWRNDFVIDPLKSSVPRRRPCRCSSFVWALALALIQVAFANSFAEALPRLKIISDREILSTRWRSPGGLQPVLRNVAPAYGASFLARAADIRWDDDEHVLIAACRDGTFRLPVVDDGRSLLERAYPPLPDMGHLGSQALLGASREFLVAAAPFHLMSWLPRTVPDPKPISIDMDFDTLTALDVSGDRLLVLGLQRLEKGTIAADGAIAWTARLGKKLTQVQPVQFSISGAGAHDMDACSDMHMGKVRFLPGGAFVVAPGAEPGIFIYDASGKLVRTWQAETVGFDAGCPITEKESDQYAADPRARFRWLNQRRVLDEILPLPGGIGFVIRTRANGLTRWELKVLTSGGKVIPYEIPVTSPSEYARLAGDVRGNRIAFLLNLDTRDTPPIGSHRLILAEVPQLSNPPLSSSATSPAPTKKPSPQKPIKP
jgi:hypothetical protein